MTPSDVRIVDPSAARAVCRAAWDARARGMVRRRLGVDVATVDALVAHLARTGAPSPDPVERGALDRVVRAHELGLDLPVAVRVFVRRALTPLGAFVGDAPNPDVLHHLATAWLPDADAARVPDVDAWWSGQVDGGPPDLRVVRASELRNALRARASDEDVRAAAGRVRGALVRRPGPCMPAHAAALEDAPLCSMFVVGSNDEDVAPPALVDAWVLAVNRDPAAASSLIHEAHALGAVGQVAALDPGPLDRPLTRDEAIGVLGRAVDPVDVAALDAWLVDRPAAAGGVLGLADTLRVARTPGVVDRIEALVNGDVDYGDFDAPGEGGLPAWWAVVALLAGRTAHAAEALVRPADADVDVQTELLAIPSDATVRAHAPGGASPVEPSAHGLRDGVAEAYGSARGDGSNPPTK